MAYGIKIKTPPVSLPKVPKSLDFGVPGAGAIGSSPVLNWDTKKLKETATNFLPPGVSALGKYYSNESTPKSSYVPSNLEMPTLSGYQSLLGPDTNYSVSNVSNTLDTSGLNALKERALSTGDSPWAKLAYEKQALEQKGLLNSATNLAATEAAQNRAAMAARGGLRGGAAMRLAGQAAQNSALGRQNVLQQGALQRADIGLNDQVQRDKFLSMLPGAQLDVARYGTGVDQFNAQQQNAANQFNIQNLLKDREAKNAWERLSYEEKMKAFAAGKTADAIAASAPQPGIIQKTLGGLF